MERPDGSVIDYATVALPEGMTMLTFVDVTDSARIQRVLSERNEALEAADRLKSDFIQHVSYELRSPLQTIIGFSELLSDETAGGLNPQQREYMDHIDSSSSRAARPDQRHPRPRHRRCRHHVARHPRGRHRGGRSARRSRGCATGSREQKHRARHGDPEGHRHVPCRRAARAADPLQPRLQRDPLLQCRRAHPRWRPSGADGSVVFTVTDDGVGIPADVMPTIFEPFEAHARAGRRRGAGLGLSIVKSLVELHGGEVDIRSEEGKGTTATVRLPVASGGGRRRRRIGRMAGGRGGAPPEPRACRRGGDRAARGGHRRGPAAGRSRRALGRARRRQDQLRARPDPRARRRSGARSAEPDLSAPHRPCAAAADRSCMPTSTGSARRTSSRRSASTRRCADARGAGRMAGTAAGGLGGEPARHRAGDGWRGATRGDRRRRHLAGAASRARGASAPSSSDVRLAGRGALRRSSATRRSAPMSGSSSARLARKGDERHPDERAGAPEGPADLRRPLLRRGGASRARRPALRRDRPRAAGRRACARLKFSAPISTPGCCCSKISAAKACSMPPARRSSERYEAAIDLLAFMHGRDWPDAAAAARWRRATACRPTTATRCSSRSRCFPDWFGGHGGEPAFSAGAARGFPRRLVGSSGR